MYSQTVDEAESVTVQEFPGSRNREAEEAIILGETPAVAAQGGPSVPAVIRMLLTLVLAAAAIYGIVYFIRKASKKNYENKDPFLKVLASAHLGLNRYAHIVSVGSKAYLVGASDGGVSLIDEVDDKDILNAMLLEDSSKSADEKPGRINDFISILRRFGLPVKQGGQNAEIIRKNRERLKGL
ncbi:MAG: flagellar biosynthetic protein FliO [Treponema sp.]|nr:flagellar biosynthetic protein FliO [Treponema sp.]